MELTLSAPRPGLTVPKRALLFVIASALGFLAGLGWNLETSGWAYDALLGIFVDPGIRIESMAMGVGLAFVLGLIHISTI